MGGLQSGDGEQLSKLTNAGEEPPGWTRPRVLAHAGRAAADPRAGGSLQPTAGTGSALCPRQCQRNSSGGVRGRKAAFRKALKKKGQVWGRRFE